MPLTWPLACLHPLKSTAPASFDPSISYPVQQRVPSFCIQAITGFPAVRSILPTCCRKLETAPDSHAMISITLFLVVALAILYVARSIQKFLSLRHFGGHWSAGWSRLWLLRTQGSGEMNKRFTTLNNKYGECPTSTCSGASICHSFAYLCTALHPRPAHGVTCHVQRLSHDRTDSVQIGDLPSVWSIRDTTYGFMALVIECFTNQTM